MSVLLCSAGSSGAGSSADLWTPHQHELVLPDAADMIAPQVSASAGAIVAAGAPGVAVERGGGYDDHKVQQSTMEAMCASPGTEIGLYSWACHDWKQFQCSCLSQQHCT